MYWRWYEVMKARSYSISKHGKWYIVGGHLKTARF